MSSFSPEDAASAAEDRADDRSANSGGWSEVRAGNSPVQADTVSPRRDGPIDPDRERLGDGSWPTDEEREVGRPGLAEARRVLEETSARLGVDAVSAATLMERSSATPSDQTSVDIAQLRAQARQLAIDTGVTHRIGRDKFGRPVVEMVPPRVKPIGKTKRSTQ